MSSPQFNALNREAGIASAAISKGINALNFASFGSTWHYNSAFFDLSVGLERIGKLIIIIDHRMKFGSFPSKSILKNEIRHDIYRIVSMANDIGIERKYDKYTRPDDPISDGIIKTLTEFAKEARYYNIDLLAGDNRFPEPISAWSERVGKPIIETHYRAADRKRAEALACRAGLDLEEYTAVLHMAEDGTPISSVWESIIESSKIPVLQNYSRMYCLRIVRHLSYLLISIGDEFRPIDRQVPYFEEYFGIYRCKDAEFLRRKKWGFKS